MRGEPNAIGIASKRACPDGCTDPEETLLH